jgi:hypothetical protein
MTILLEDITTVAEAIEYAQQELSGVDPDEVAAGVVSEAIALGADPTTVEGAIIGAQVVVFG